MDSQLNNQLVFEEVQTKKESNTFPNTDKINSQSTYVSTYVRIIILKVMV